MSEEKDLKWEKLKANSDKFEDIDFNEADETPEVVTDNAPEEVADSTLEDETNLAEELALAQKKATDNWNKVLRMQAELDNMQRRSSREIENAYKFGGEKLINSFLPVMDSLEQALQLAQDNTDMQEGLKLTVKLFLDSLNKQNVEQLNPEGEIFDPQKHEAMSILVKEDVPANTIITVFQKGYALNNRIIRPARVIVSKNK